MCIRDRKYGDGKKNRVFPMKSQISNHLAWTPHSTITIICSLKTWNLPFSTSLSLPVTLTLLYYPSHTTLLSKFYVSFENYFFCSIIKIIPLPVLLYWCHQQFSLSHWQTLHVIWLLDLPRNWATLIFIHLYSGNSHGEMKFNELG